MDFLGGLGNIFHAIGGFFNGGNNQPQQQQPQPQPRPVSIAPPTQAPAQLFRPGAAPAQQPNIIMPQSQAPAPDQIHLVQPLQKSNPNPTPPQASPQQNTNIIHTITHNPVTNLAGGLIKSVAEPLVNTGEDVSNGIGNAEVGIAHALGLAKNAKTETNQQQFGTINNAVGLPTQDNNLKNFALNTGQTALTVLAPGVDGLIGDGVRAVIPAASDLLAKTVGGGAIGGAFNAAKAIENNENAGNVLKSGGEGVLAGGALAGGGGVLSKLFPSLLGAAGRTLNFQKAAQSATDAADTGTSAGESLHSTTPAEPDLSPTTPTTSDLSEAIKSNMGKVNNAHFDDKVMQSYSDTGIQDPYNLTVNALARMTNKSDIRNVVQSLVGSGADSSTVNRLTKAFTAAQTPDEVHGIIDNMTREATEVSPGLTSVNPNQANDAASQLLQKAQATNPAVSPAEVPPQPPVEASMGTSPGTPPNPTEGPVSANPQISTPQPSMPVQPIATPPTEPIPSSTIVPSESPLPNNVAQPPTDVNMPPSNRTAPNAPNIRTALNQRLQDAAKIAGEPTEHNVLGNKELQQAGEDAVAPVPINELVQRYSGVPDLSKTADQAYARGAIIKLSQALEGASPENAAAIKQAMNNIGEGLEKGISGAARSMNFAQSMIDSLPRQARIPFVITRLDNIREAAGMPLIKDDVALQSQVTSQLDKLFAQQEATKARVASLEDHANTAALSADNGTKVDTSGLHNQLATDRATLAKQNGEITKYYQTLTPGSTVGQKLNALARAGMLSSPTGRANTVGFAGANTLYQGAQNITQGLLAKAVNLVKPGSATDTLQGNSKVLSGVRQGGADIWDKLHGAQFVDDTQKALKGDASALTNLRSGPGTNYFPKTTNLINTASHASSDLTQGVRDQRLYQLAVKEGQQKGLTGDMLQQYAEGRSAVPTRQMSANADQLWKSLNHINDNPISNTLNRLSNAIDPAKLPPDATFGAKMGNFIAGAIKNQILPFTSFLGGNMWNSITDKNVVASFLKLLNSAGHRDVDGIVENLAKTANNAAYTYALGYLMTQHGLLTNTDANGYNDGGAYLHVANRYIPVNDLGFFSPSLILGNALYQGLNGGGNAMQQFGKTLGASILNGYKSIGGMQLGVDNNAVKIQSTLTGTGKVPGDPAAAAAQAGEGVVSQGIPAFTGDINAVLNHTPLNPTGEAAQTKITKGQDGQLTATGHLSTAKDIIPSLAASLLNRIPVASQLALPRNPAVNAPDLLDRFTRGSSVGAPQAAAKAQAATALSKAKDNYNNDIPMFKPVAGSVPKGYNFDDVVNTDIQTGNYDKAVAGLQDKLNTLNSTKDIPPSTKQALQDSITQLNVADKNKIPYSDMQLYNSTSKAAWNAMGNPAKSTYDPATYQKLWAIDQALAQAGVAGEFRSISGSSGTTKISSNQKYSLTASSSSGSKSAANRAAALIKSDTISGLPSQPRESFVSNLSAKGITTQIPQIKLTPPQGLIKAHAISVGFPRGNYN